MLHFDKIDLNEGTDLAKSNNSKGGIVCHYWVFNHCFKFQHSISNGCHDLTMFYLSPGEIAIIIAKNVDYCSIFQNISKYDTIRLSKDFLLDVCGYI